MKTDSTGVVAKIRDDFRFYRGIDPEQGFWGACLDRHFLVCANYRFGFWACQLRVPLVGRLLRTCYVFTNLIISAITGTDIRSGAIIGRRFNVHTYYGILIADGVVIGDDCTILTGTVIGSKVNDRSEGPARIGNNVKLTSGCKVIGPVTIGDNVIVGANAVVIRDVPSGHMALGVPARNVPLYSSDTCTGNPGKVVSFPGSEGYVNNTMVPAEDPASALDRPLEEEVECPPARASDGIGL